MVGSLRVVVAPGAIPDCTRGKYPEVWAKSMRLLKPSLFPAQFISLLLLVFCGSVAPAKGQNGAYTAPADLDALVQTASIIVRGNVVSAKIEPVPNLPNLRSVVVTMSVTKMIKGRPASTLTFRQFLWDARDSSVFSSYKQSGELLIFLNPVSSYGLTSPVGLEQGRFRVLRDPKGGQYVVNGRGNLGLFNEVTTKAGSRGVSFPPKVLAMLSKPSGKVPLDSFESAIVALMGASR